MSAIAAPYISVPSTFNALDPFQRAHLVRSTRKLGHVLGTTPIIFGAHSDVHERHDLNELLPIGPKPGGSGSHSVAPPQAKSRAAKLKAKATRRHGSLFNAPISTNPSANSSSTSLSSLSSTYSQVSSASTTALRETKGFSATRQRKADAPAPLTLQSLNSVPIKITDVPLDTSGGSQSSPVLQLQSSSNAGSVGQLGRSRSGSTILSAFGTGAGVPTPLTPSFRLRAAANPTHRRQKLQKLTRTLGENIPPSLVFPAQLRADLSAPASPTLESSKSSTTGATRTPRTPTFGNSRRGPVSRSRSNRRRSASISALYMFDANVRLPLRPPARLPARNPKGSSRWEPPSEWADGPSDLKKREENDQVLGIWSTGNYDSVMCQLRALRK
ncbi:hypothetical protein M0805_006917 [Coniferiporia weirii]|nr:hypothetical protein M0805_006917 [Coniferiporia weirii]